MSNGLTSPISFRTSSLGNSSIKIGNGPVAFLNGAGNVAITFDASVAKSSSVGG
jgi:hypothetical protein